MGQLWGNEQSHTWFQTAKVTFNVIQGHLMVPFDGPHTICY